MSAETFDHLQRVEKGVLRLGRDVLVRALRPGETSVRVRALLSSVGLVSTSQLEELYAWRNGTDMAGVVAADDVHLFPGFYMLSVEDAVANYRAFSSDSRWTAGWLPVFTNGGGDSYVVDLSGESGAPVRHFRIDEVEHPIEFASLAAMIHTISTAFERRLFFVDRNGYLEMDDAAFAELAGELNPQVGWWG